MRLVDVTSFFSDSCGGIKTYYRQKARHLPSLGVDCHFVVPGRVSTAEPFGRGTLYRLPGPTVPFNPQYRLFGPGAELGSLLRRLSPDVVEVGSHYLLPGMIEDAVDSLGGRRPAMVGFFHSDVPRTMVEPLVRWMPAPLGRRVVNAAWSFVRRQHARYESTLVGSHEVEATLRENGVPRLRWVGLGVDIDVFRPDAGRRVAGPPTVVYVGRLSPDKGVGVLLRAMDTIHETTGARLRLVGDGPSRASVQRFARARPFVSVEGYVDAPERVAEILASADAVVTPGARETFSLATAEAMACGTPVVAPDEGGARELVAESGAGLLFRAGSAPWLASAVVDLLERPASERHAIGARGRSHVLARLTWPAVARRLLDAYRGTDSGRLPPS